MKKLNQMRRNVTSNIAPSVMLCCMFGYGHYLKVFNSVIKFVSVDVVDYFFRFKGTLDLFFHDETMKMCIFSIMANSFVTMNVNIYRIIRSIYSVQTAMFAKSLIMLSAKTFAISLAVAAFYFTNIRKFVVRTCLVNITMSILSRIMFTAKIYSKNGIVAILNFTYKIFHISNINQFDEFVKHNLS